MPRTRRGRINGSKRGNRIPAATETEAFNGLKIGNRIPALKSKSLYICFAQRHKTPHFERWVVLRVRMSDVLSSESKQLHLVPFEKVADEIDFGGERLPFIVGCGVFKSKILLGGGLKPKLEEFWLPPSSRMYCFETSGPKLKLESFPDLIGGTCCPLLFEIQGTLYALDGDVQKVIPGYNPPHFERFDDDKVWKPLPGAPIWDPDSPYYYKGPVGSSYVIAGTSILLSRPGRTPVFRFDIKAPRAGWSEQKSLCSGNSFPFRGKTLVQDCPPHAGGGFIIFAMDIESPRIIDEMDVLPSTFPSIPVYLMSKDYDSLNLLETVELPFPDALPSSFRYPCGYSFLDIGDQRVGLVLAAFTGPDFPAYSDNEKMEFLVTTFKYELSISRDSPSGCSFKYQCLSDPVILEHSMEQPSSVFAEMLGAFVL